MVDGLGIEEDASTKGFHFFMKVVIDRSCFFLPWRIKNWTQQGRHSRTGALETPGLRTATGLSTEKTVGGGLCLTRTPVVDWLCAGWTLSDAHCYVQSDSKELTRHTTPLNGALASRLAYFLLAITRTLSPFCELNPSPPTPTSFCLQCFGEYKQRLHIKVTRFSCVQCWRCFILSYQACGFFSFSCSWLT